MIGFTIREAQPSEQGMVLSNWKLELAERRHLYGWGKSLRPSEFWALANYVIDKITLPSCQVWVGCHFSVPETPVCWAAIRRVPGLIEHEIVFMYARLSIRDDPALGAECERALLSELSKVHPLAVERRPFNPFLELRR